VSGTWRGGFACNLGPCAVLMAEFWGILIALQLAWDKGYKLTVLESNSAVTVSLVVKGSLPSHPWSSIVC